MQRADVIKRIEQANLYKANETMEMLGHQCYFEVIGNKGLEEIDNIMQANIQANSSLLEMAMGIFTLGYIYGKRAERAKRKR